MPGIADNLRIALPKRIDDQVRHDTVVASAAAVTELAVPGLGQAEVEELLYCNPADVSRLAKLKLIHGASAGRRPAFDAREVEALSGEFISGRELCARTSRAASALSVTLKNSGWPGTRPVFGRDAESRLSCLHFSSETQRTAAHSSGRNGIRYTGYEP